MTPVAAMAAEMVMPAEIRPRAVIVIRPVTIGQRVDHYSGRNGGAEKRGTATQAAGFRRGNCSGRKGCNRRKNESSFLHVSFLFDRPPTDGNWWCALD